MKTVTVERDVFVPKNTPPSSPLRLEVPVGKGLVIQTRVTFPPGPAGYVGVRVRVGGVQVVPQRLSDWLIGDDTTFTYSAPVNLFGTDGMVTVEVYNEDTVYDHTIILTFETLFTLETPEEVLARLVSEKVDLKLSDLRGILETMLTALVEIKGELEKLAQLQFELAEKAKIESLKEQLRSLDLSELIRI